MKKSRRFKNVLQLPYIVVRSKTSTDSNPTSSTEDSWKEINEIYFPFPPENTNSSNSTTLSKVLEEHPRARGLLFLLIGCLLFILIGMILLGLKYYYSKRKKNGYKSAPQFPPDQQDSTDDLIAEITNRREPKIASKSTIFINPKSNQTLSPSTTNSSKNVSVKNSENRIQQPLTRTQSVNDKFALLAPQCTIPEHKKIELIPHETLAIPPVRKVPSLNFDSSRSNGNVDKLLSLSNLEKILMRQSLNTPNSEQINNSEEFPEISLRSDEDHRMEYDQFPDLLTPEENIEERLKFLNQCRHNEASRRRSLCTLCRLEEFGDTRIETPPTLHTIQEPMARKVQSMPKMHCGSFMPNRSGLDSNVNRRASNSNTFTLSIPEKCYKQQSQFNTREDNYIPNSPLEWQDVNGAYTLLSEYISTGANSVRTKSKETSNTSIWSTLASENTMDLQDYPDPIYMISNSCSLEDNDTYLSPIEELPEVVPSLNSSQLHSNNISKNEQDLIEMEQRTINNKQSVANIIELSAKLKGYTDDDSVDSRKSSKFNDNPRIKRSSESRFLLDSDTIPSALFERDNSTSSLTKISNESFTSLDNRLSNRPSTSFWFQKVVSGKDANQKPIIS